MPKLDVNMVLDRFHFHTAKPYLHGTEFGDVYPVYRRFVKKNHGLTYNNCSKVFKNLDLDYHIDETQQKANSRSIDGQIHYCAALRLIRDLMFDHATDWRWLELALDPGDKLPPPPTDPLPDVFVGRMKQTVIRNVVVDLETALESSIPFMENPDDPGDEIFKAEFRANFQEYEESYIAGFEKGDYWFCFWM